MHEPEARRRGVVLHRPPGSGKSSFIRSVGGRLVDDGFVVTDERAQLECGHLDAWRMVMGPSIGTVTLVQPSASPAGDDGSKGIKVIADYFGSLFGTLHSASQHGMTGTTARRNVAATAAQQTARSVGHPEPTRRAPTARFVG